MSEIKNNFLLQRLALKTISNQVILKYYKFYYINMKYQLSKTH